MKKLLFALIFSTSLVACQKAELKKPTAVNFAFDLNKNFGPGMAVKMNSGTINLVDFRIIGDRVEGEDIDFKRNFGVGLHTDINNSGEIQEMNFDIPQGEYTKINLELDVSAVSEPSLTLEGSYKITQGPNVKLIFEYTGAQKFTIEGEDFNQNSSIIMDADLGKKVSIEFDPIYWFDGLTSNQLDNADITPQQGQDAIILSESSNVGLYEIVANRMTDSNKAIFK